MLTVIFYFENFRLMALRLRLFKVNLELTQHSVVSVLLKTTLLDYPFWYLSWHFSWHLLIVS